MIKHTHPHQNVINIGDITGSDSPLHRFRHKAMATFFEIFISCEDPEYASQAAWAAFDELNCINNRLSRFIENSDISRINNLQPSKPLTISPDAFHCLKIALQIYHETDGAFDITTGSLYECWLDKNKNLLTPSDEMLLQARSRTGSHLIQLNENEHTVTIKTDGLKVDLGGIGKGYALDQMAALLREWDIESAMIHAGASTALALNCPQDTNGFPVTISNPADRRKKLARILLKNRALSGSGLQKGPHIIDPKTAKPIDQQRAAWTAADTAACADALSTAFIIMSPENIKRYCQKHPSVRALIARRVKNTTPDKQIITHFGNWNDDEFCRLGS